MPPHAPERRRRPCPSYPYCAATSTSGSNPYDTYYKRRTNVVVKFGDIIVYNFHYKRRTNVVVRFGDIIVYDSHYNRRTNVVIKFEDIIVV